MCIKTVDKQAVQLADSGMMRKNATSHLLHEPFGPRVFVSVNMEK